MNKAQQENFERRYGADKGDGWQHIHDLQYAAYSAACADEAERVKGLVADAVRVIEAWDSTVLPRGYDGMMQERMECLRAALKAYRGE